jgi:hypothetical protein
VEKLNELLARLASTDESLDSLLAKDDLAEADIAEHDRLVAERGKTLAAIDREKARLEREAERQKLEADAEAEGAKRTAEAEAQAKKRKLEDERNRRIVAQPPQRLSTPDAPTSGRTPTAVRTDDQGRTTGFFEQTDETVRSVRRGPRRPGGGCPTGSQAQACGQAKAEGYSPWGEFKSFREYVQAGLEGHDTRGFEERHRKHFAAVQGMSEGIGSDGGYTVMPEFASGIIDRVYSNDLWSRTDNYTVSGNNMTFLANAETSACHRQPSRRPARLLARRGRDRDLQQADAPRGQPETGEGSASWST